MCIDNKKEIVKKEEINKVVNYCRKRRKKQNLLFRELRDWMKD